MSNIRPVSHVLHKSMYISANPGLSGNTVFSFKVSTSPVSTSPPFFGDGDFAVLKSVNVMGHIGGAPELLV